MVLTSVRLKWFMYKHRGYFSFFKQYERCNAHSQHLIWPKNTTVEKLWGFVQLAFLSGYNNRIVLLPSEGCNRTLIIVRKTFFILTLKFAARTADKDRFLHSILLLLRIYVSFLRSILVASSVHIKRRSVNLLIVEHVNVSSLTRLIGIKRL